MCKNHRSEFSTTHPFVGLIASGEYVSSAYNEPLAFSTTSGIITSCDGKSAHVLTDTGEIRSLLSITLVDPAAATRALLASLSNPSTPE